MRKIVNICRPEVLDGLLKRYDAEVLFFEARRHMCLMCTHVAHWQNLEKNSKFSKIVFRQKSAQKHLISITCSFEQNRRKIIDFRAFWNFSIFENFGKKMAINSKFEQKFFFQNLGFENFSKVFSRYSVSKNRQRNLSFR